jgi:hypothetical protein
MAPGCRLGLGSGTGQNAGIGQSIGAIGPEINSCYYLERRSEPKSEYPPQAGTFLNLYRRNETMVFNHATGNTIGHLAFKSKEGSRVTFVAPEWPFLTDGLKLLDKSGFLHVDESELQPELLHDIQPGDRVSVSFDYWFHPREGMQPIRETLDLWKV